MRTPTKLPCILLLTGCAHAGRVDTDADGRADLRLDWSDVRVRPSPRGPGQLLINVAVDNLQERGVVESGVWTLDVTTATGRVCPVTTDAPVRVRPQERVVVQLHGSCPRGAVPWGEELEVDGSLVFTVGRRPRAVQVDEALDLAG